MGIGSSVAQQEPFGSDQAKLAELVYLVDLLTHRGIEKVWRIFSRFFQELSKDFCAALRLVSARSRTNGQPGWGNLRKTAHILVLAERVDKLFAAAPDIE